MQGIDFWRLADELSIVQAAMLVIGVNPSGNEYKIEQAASPSEGYEAIKHSITTSLQSGILEGKVIIETDTQYGEEYVNTHKSLVKVNALKEWLKEKGIHRHFFFFPEEPAGEFLSEDHPRYSPKLAAAVSAWQALDDHTLHEKRLNSLSLCG